MLHPTPTIPIIPDYDEDEECIFPVEWLFRPNFILCHFSA